TALVKHVLCAESDEERDAWVDALLSYVETNSSDEENLSQGNQTSKLDAGSKTSSSSGPKSRLLPTSTKKGTKGSDSPDSEQMDALRAFSYDDVVAAEAPVLGLGGGKTSPLGRSGAAPENANVAVHQSGWDQNMPMTPSYKNISGPTNGVKIQDAGAWGNKTPSTPKEKKRSSWEFRAATSADLVGQGHRHD